MGDAAVLLGGIWRAHLNGGADNVAGQDLVDCHPECIVISRRCEGRRYFCLIELTLRFWHRHKSGFHLRVHVCCKSITACVRSRVRRRSFHLGSRMKAWVKSTVPPTEVTCAVSCAIIPAATAFCT